MCYYASKLKYETITSKLESYKCNTRNLDSCSVLWFSYQIIAANYVKQYFGKINVTLETKKFTYRFENVLKQNHNFIVKCKLYKLFYFTIPSGRFYPSIESFVEIKPTSNLILLSG